METKICARCKQEKPLDQFCKNSQQRDGHNVYCKSCQKIINKKWRDNNPEYFKAYSKNYNDNNKLYIANKSMINNHGISIEQKSAILKNQNNKCAICGKNIGLLGRDSHIDHNHETGKVRAVLCQRCNHLIGDCLESVDILNNAINYLKLHNK